MASEGGGTPKKTTAEIMAEIRAKKAAAAAAESAPAEAVPPAAETKAPPAEAAPAETPAAAPPSASATAAPKATSDILAAIRAKKAGGEPPAPAAPAAGTPKSTADILAAARGKTAAPAAAKPAAAKAETAKTAAAVPAGGPKPSVEEMLAAVKAGTPIAPAAPAKKAAPPMPARPAPSAKAAAKKPEGSRRGFLAAMLSAWVVSWVTFTVATVLWLLESLRFMIPNLLTEPPSKFKVGTPADFDLGTVSEKFKAQYGIWIVHTDKYKGRNLIYALSSVCTHLGCTPSWLEGEQKFKCPCHGSGFYINGINFEGPAPRPLERVGIRIDPGDGMLEVDKSVKFQEELGQWNDPSSFYEIV